jgi:uncharacterized protein YndB with AHSA1/START domain
MTGHGTYETPDGRPALRFERVYPHPPAAVWAAVTDPDELAHWFPAVVEVDLREGGAITFVFADPDLAPGSGRVLEVEPQRTFAFTWNDDELRFELAPHDAGTRLVFTHFVDAADRAARDLAGWHVCLDRMGERLDGGSPQAPSDAPTEEWSALYEEYARRGAPIGAPVPD